MRLLVVSDWVWVWTADMSDASDYFNSLPTEDRLRLAPLLEEYRQLGLREAAEYLRAAQRKLSERLSGSGR
jgi:hypothetical protein